jgi:hypothetical protein
MPSSYLTLLARRAVATSLALSMALASLPAFAGGRAHPAPEGQPTRAAVDEAKALYIAGNRAVEQGRWADALTDFERSYALSGVAAALFNVASALRALGRHVEARDAFAQLLASHPKLDPEVKKKAEAMLTGERARIVLLTLAGLPPRDPALRISVDGSATADDGTRPLPLDVDPGRRAVRVDDGKSKPFLWEGLLADGERKSLTVRLTPAEAATPPAAPAAAPAAPAAPAAHAADGSSGGVLSSPLFWGIIGVVVVGGAVAGGYLWHQSRQLEPASGTVVKL